MIDPLQNLFRERESQTCESLLLLDSMEFDHSCPFAAAIYGTYQRLSVPTLFRYADTGKWDLIPDRARKCPKEAKFVHKYAPCDTTLHRLLRPLHVVQSTTVVTPPNSTNTAPTTTQVASSTSARCTPSDSLPHGAQQGDDFDLKHQRSTDVLTSRELQRAKEKEELIAVDPTGITTMLICAVEALLEANPDAACHANLFGRTPLHLACMELNNNSTTAPARAQAAMLLLQQQQQQHTKSQSSLRARPPLVSIQDHHGCTALHYLLMNHANNIPRELLQTMLDLDAIALERKNTHGQSPLDVFVAFNGQDDHDDRATTRVQTEQKLGICQVLRKISSTLTSVDVVVGH
jgi:hypothetical protein